MAAAKERLLDSYTAGRVQEALDDLNAARCTVVGTISIELAGERFKARYDDNVGALVVVL